MKIHVKFLYALSIMCIIGGFALIAFGDERSTISWGITSLICAFIFFVIGDTEQYKKPPHDNPYSL